MTARSKFRILGALSVFLVCAGLAVVFFRDPGRAGSYPSCPSLALTGLYCPGCGTLRALHLLLHGDFAGAVGMNVLMVVSIPFLAYYGVSLLLVRRGRAPLPGCRAAGSRPFVLATIFPPSFLKCEP